MSYADVIGSLAAVLTSVAFLPQVIRVWRTRSARDISLGMYAAFVTGVACWVAYGLLIRAWPVVAANLVTFLLACGVLLLKLRYDREDSRARPTAIGDSPGASPGGRGAAR
jgi:MtN3 and saliva related transmembrane protein